MKGEILVTGGSGKIGRTLVKHFISSGYRVAVVCKRKSSCQDLQEEFRDSGQQLLCIQIDLTSKDAATNLIHELTKESFFPSAIIFNARDPSTLRASQQGTPHRDDFITELILAVIFPTELATTIVNSPNCELQSIVFISSQYGLVAPNLTLYQNDATKSFIHYGVAKAAQIHLTKELAVRLASNNVRVNCVALGGVQGRVDQKFLESYSRLCPTGRMLQAHEVIGPIEFLISESASSVTGETLTADGGWSIW